VEGNVGLAEDAERVVEATISTFGAVDILVNNAATNPYAGPVIDTDIPRWEKTFQVNLTAPLVWTQLCWNSWMKEHGGEVINISSVGAFATSPILGTYDITKLALVQLTRQLAAEMSPGVRVNAVCPGLIKTDFARALWDEGRGDQVAQAYPLKRLGEPEDIANAALYLASEASGWMTGQALVVDGGGLIGFAQIG
jgi:NAD(P)-dependent dehydrogenase (short-subunit alcohol dehydrogenase family)